MGNFGLKELVVILLVVLVVFGAKKLKTIGSDLGSAVRGFKKSMADGEEEENHPRQLSADAEFPESKGGSAASSNAAPDQKTSDRRSA